MMKKYITKNVIIVFTIILIWGGYYLYSQMSAKFPFEPPKTVIKYNGKAIPTSFGDHNWISKNGGSSYETGGEYTVGLNISKFNAKPGDIVYILIPSNPKNIKIDQILDNDYRHKEYKTSKEGKEYIFTLPIEKGEYIFNVFAKWDTDKHNTATIFRVQIK